MLTKHTKWQKGGERIHLCVSETIGLLLSSERQFKSINLFTLLNLGRYIQQNRLKAPVTLWSIKSESYFSLFLKTWALTLNYNFQDRLCMSQCWWKHNSWSEVTIKSVNLRAELSLYLLRLYKEHLSHRWSVNRLHFVFFLILHQMTSSSLKRPTKRWRTLNNSIPVMRRINKCVHEYSEI